MSAMNAVIRRSDSGMVISKTLNKKHLGGAQKSV